MQGHVILSHGSESGPDATKVSALGRVAESLGWRVTRVDYRDLDAQGEVACIEPRIARLKSLITPGERCVLGGSSMGSFVSGFASLDVPVAALFLLALPITIAGYARRYDAARVTTTIVHGWDDALCPADAAIAFARERGASLVLVPDGHRLSNHVDFIAQQFHTFLSGVSA